MRKDEKVFWLVMISFLILPYVFVAQVDEVITASFDIAWIKENNSPAQEALDATESSEGIEVDQTVAWSSHENLAGTMQGGGHQMLQSSSGSSSASFSRHMMCGSHYSYWNGTDIVVDPIDPRTIFRPSDPSAECLVTVSINDLIEFRWYYRSNSSKTWVSCYNWSTIASNPGEYRQYHFWSWLNISGFWPGKHYPRAYKVDVHLDGSSSPAFSEFFEVTNGGLNSPRMSESVDVDGNPINMTSRFTIGEDTKAHHFLRFDRIAYFNEELGYSHNFTTVWIQPNGSMYKTYSGNFSDYKDDNITRNYWQYGYSPYDYIFINPSTPVGNWKVEVYLDSYFNNTWTSYGPVATTPFTIGNETVPDWTVMVYLDADNDLEEAGIDIFEKMASVGNSSQVNIVVQMDRIPGLDQSYGGWTDCKRFYVTKDMTPELKNSLPWGKEVNMGHPDTLKDFVNWTINNYPANYYFLVLWDHGAGCIGLCVDFTSANDFLSLSELSQALSGLPAIMDVVLLDACSMAMTEVAYQLKDYANVQVGHEGLGYSPAPYDQYLLGLTNNPSMLPSAFAKEVVTDYIDWTKLIGDIQNATMSAIDLTKITSLTAAMDDFALKLKEKETPYLSLLSASHEQIIQARNLTEGYPGPWAGDYGYYIDLYHFAQLINQYVLDEELRNIAAQVMTTIESTVIIEDDKASPNSYGLSIFFPDEKEKYESFKSDYEETALTEDIAWEEFVKYHLSAYVLTIQTPYPNVTIEIDEWSNETDAEGKLRVFVLPDSYIVNVTTIVDNIAGPGSRGNFTQWSDNDTSNPRTVLVDGTLTLEAQYETQYYVTIDQSGSAVTLNAIIDTLSHELPISFWWTKDSTHNVSVPPTVSGDPDTQYNFTHWDGSETDSLRTITVAASTTYTAYYETQYKVIFSQSGVGTDFTGTIVTIDKKPYNLSVLPISFWWNNDTTHAFAFQSSMVVTSYAKQYVWNSTSGLSSQKGETITISMSGVVIGNYGTQYYLTLETSPLGVVSPLGEGWYYNGTDTSISTDDFINITAGASRYRFNGWTTTDMTEISDSTSSSTAIRMDKAKMVTANYVTQYFLIVRIDPTGLSPGSNVSPPGPWYDDGTLVTCTAQNIGGQLFDQWTVNGASRNQGDTSITITMDQPCEVTAHYVRALAWWETLFRIENLPVILGLVGIVLTATLVGTVWIRTRRKREIMKPPVEPIPIEVTEVLPCRVATGHADLDNLLFGGIPENYTVILTSPSCDERDLLVKRFLETGAKKGEVTVYLTADPGEIESLAEEFQSSFYLFLCNPRADMIIKSLPNVFKLKGVENLTDIGIALTKAFRRLNESATGPKRACIEIISDVLLQHHAVVTRRWLTDLITELRSRNFTTLAVMNPKMHPSEEVHAILGLFEGEINIYERAREERFLKIKKMRNQRYLDSELPLKKRKSGNLKK